MKGIISTVICLLALACGATAQAGEIPAGPEDEKAIRAIIAKLAEDWTAGDARAWAEPFAEDADFTVVNGLQLKGREAVVRGHEQIFATIFKDTKQQLAVRSIRFLRDDVAVVHVEGSVVKKGEEFPASPQVVPLFVLVKSKGGWQITVFQNTRVQKPQG
jgi:uncharacterized protein (TIGR02246 family)